jgi:hypothetical protein
MYFRNVVTILEAGFQCISWAVKEAASGLRERRKSVKMRSSNQKGSSTSGEYEPNPGPRPKRILIVSHWNAILGLVAIGVLYALLPVKVSIGPSWLLLAVEGVFILPFVIARLTRRKVSPVTLRVGSLILLGIVSLT